MTLPYKTATCNSLQYIILILEESILFLLILFLVTTMTKIASVKALLHVAL